MDGTRQTHLARNVDTAGPVFKPAVTPWRRPFNYLPARAANPNPNPLLPPSISLTLLPVLHHLLPPFLPTASWRTQLPSHLALRTPLWRRHSFQQTLTLLACGDHLALDVVLRVLKIMILNYSLCY